MTVHGVGRATVTPIVESTASFDRSVVFPDAAPAEWAQAEARACRSAPRQEYDRLEFVVQCFLIRTPESTVLIDTAVGDGKDRPRWPRWHRRTGGVLLRELARVGVTASDVDIVVNTHLHIDHVGGNTVSSPSGWVPTFPNARYLVSREEYEHLVELPGAEHARCVGDSIAPLVDADRVDWVEGARQVIPEVWLDPTAGHTVGHMSVRVESEAEVAVITGDVLHDPVQCARPDWSTRADDDPLVALRTRRDFVERYANSAAVVFGSHFRSPTAGLIVGPVESRCFVFLGEGPRTTTESDHPRDPAATT
ncbi:MBL fold metallo-hydrolase [Pseudonocardia xishanensis]|uniref:MBL fold metallo-hydrolase n=1 Tax=Pseudonocardia xishanensis TaxID=630995 RepID=A0ABP8RZS6_9PSEU